MRKDRGKNDSIYLQNVQKINQKIINKKMGREWKRMHTVKL